ncbi:glutamate-5-semialdehyde dehydrogenase [Proteiniphilum sp. X52]|uniref:glutamate-5-semialdehyde dehydrogenase n=1 Tax=Proteiniphilum sp. X52 TaxID=2382159 RepID=UPI000F0A4516|nr:glutamate-5-semialdehyde dehydrogenase [Proteiniphilum sp. X52]RNC64371.1 glutamate-5-semialdehyde dehydrogenase [Proteiniphilum sp. X52]
MKNEQKNDVLLSLGQLLELNRENIMKANEADISAYPGMDDSMLDRLKVDEKKIDGMIRSLEEVASQPDPEGKTLYEFVREDRLRIVNQTVPFGTILIIYESRPDVTIEAAATAFKAGNHILLKGGKEARQTNLLLTGLWQQALAGQNASTDYIQYLDLSREETQRLIRENSHRVDLIIPRGGEGLIRFVQENASVPVIVSGRGNNFLYVDDNSDFAMAVRLVVNGKKRISVCNAIDKVLLHKDIDELEEKLSNLVTNLAEKGIEVWGNKEIASLHNSIKVENNAATLCEEYLAPKLYTSLVDGIQDAIHMINHYSGGHTAVIVTNDATKAVEFMQQVDCAAVYHNASSRFTDGGQFGVGAEIAISTQKLHFRGPLGAQELVTNKWFVYGNGQIRE